MNLLFAHNERHHDSDMEGEGGDDVCGDEIPFGCRLYDDGDGD